MSKKCVARSPLIHSFIKSRIFWWRSDTFIEWKCLFSPYLFTSFACKSYVDDKFGQFHWAVEILHWSGQRTLLHGTLFCPVFQYCLLYWNVAYCLIVIDSLHDKWIWLLSNRPNDDTIMWRNSQNGEDAWCQQTMIFNTYGNGISQSNGKIPWLIHIFYSSRITHLLNNQKRIRKCTNSVSYA